MANVSRFGPFRHLRAEPNQFILHYRGGKVVRSGPGIAYWFNPLSAAVAQVPVEDYEITFLLNERSADFQEVSVQCALTFRVVDHARAAARVNFAISLDNGAWLERPLERLASLWAMKTVEPVRAYLAGVAVVDAVRSGADRIRAALDQTLRADTAMSDMGLALVTVQVTRVAPTAELEKALQTPTREALQQKADEALFARRALAVEKERAIKENELATELELARRQTQLIEQRQANDRLTAQAEAERIRIAAEAESEKSRIAMVAYARDQVVRAEGDTANRRLWDAVEADREATRVALWKNTPTRVATAFALQTAAAKLDKVNHLNVTPDLLKGVLEELVAERG